LVNLSTFSRIYKEFRPRGPGFDLSPEGICDAYYFSVFWNNGVME